MEHEKPLPRILVTKVGILTAQVCVEKDASDAEIIVELDKQAPTGLEGGWAVVVRSSTEMPHRNPVSCAKHPDRLYILVDC